jgi:hypothetical protein
MINLKHIVNVPTRITKNTATLLDVVITNEKSINSLKVIDLGLSDHYAQILSILIQTSVIYHTELKKDSLVKLMFRNFLIYSFIPLFSIYPYTGRIPRMWK